MGKTSKSNSEFVIPKIPNVTIFKLPKPKTNFEILREKLKQHSITITKLPNDIDNKQHPNIGRNIVLPTELSRMSQYQKPKFNTSFRLNNILTNQNKITENIVRRSTRAKKKIIKYDFSTVQSKDTDKLVISKNILMLDQQEECVRSINEIPFPYHVVKLVEQFEIPTVEITTTDVKNAFPDLKHAISLLPPLPLEKRTNNENSVYDVHKMLPNKYFKILRPVFMVNRDVNRNSSVVQKKGKLNLSKEKNEKQTANEDKKSKTKELSNDEQEQKSESEQKLNNSDNVSYIYEVVQIERSEKENPLCRKCKRINGVTNISDLYKFFDNAPTTCGIRIVQYLQKIGIMQTNIKCTKCSAENSLKFIELAEDIRQHNAKCSAQRNGCMWKCTKCLKVISIRTGSWFDDIRALHLKDILSIMYCWSQNYSEKDTYAVVDTVDLLVIHIVFRLLNLIPKDFFRSTYCKIGGYGCVIDVELFHYFDMKIIGGRLENNSNYYFYYIIDKWETFDVNKIVTAILSNVNNSSTLKISRNSELLIHLKKSTVRKLKGENNISIRCQYEKPKISLQNFFETFAKKNEKKFSREFLQQFLYRRRISKKTDQFLHLLSMIKLLYPLQRI